MGFEAVFKAIADFSSVKSEAKEAGTALDKMGKSAGDVGQQSGVAEKKTSSFGSTIGKVGAILGSAFVVTKVLDGGRKMIDTFAELEDVSAAAGVTFGKSMGVVQAAANGAATSVGISKREYLDGAITMGTFGKSAGLAGNDLANFSTQLVQTAGDMASFRGTTPQEAIEAVGSALRGEMEPIRKYGVLLDDASVRQEAFRMGIIDTTKSALTPQQRVLAVQSLILKQTSDAQGDFQRTADSTANTQKTLAAETENAAAAFGAKLAPMMVQAQRAGIGLLKWATDNSEALTAVAAVTGTVVGGLLAIAGALKAIALVRSAVTLAQDLGAAIVKVRNSSPEMAAGLNQIERGTRRAAIGFAALATASAIGSIIQGDIDRANGSIDQMTNQLKAAAGPEGMGALDSQFAKVHSKFFLWETGTSAVKGMADALKQSSDNAQGFAGFMSTSASWVAGIFGTKTALGEVNDQIRNLDQALAQMPADQAAKLFAQIRIEALQQGVSIEALNRMFPEYTSAVKAANIATDGAATSTAAATVNSQAWQEQLIKAANAALALSGNEIGLEAAIDNASESVKKNGATLDIHTEKGRANRQALNEIASAGMSVVSSLIEQKASTDEVVTASNHARDAFIKVAEKMGASKEEAEKLADKLGLVKRKANDLDGTNIKITAGVVMNKAADEVQYFVTGHGTVKFTAAATGGRRSGWTLVGEKGPELVDLGDDAMVYTADQTSDMLRNAGFAALAGSPKPIDLSVAAAAVAASSTSTQSWATSTNEQRSVTNQLFIDGLQIGLDPVLEAKVRDLVEAVGDSRRLDRATSGT